MNISIIIFCYNEHASIGQVIQSSLDIAAKLGNDHEVIVVDDGSTDGSHDVIAQYSAIKYIQHQQNRGIGAALRTGYEAATMQYVCAVPGDGQFDLAELLAIREFGFDTFYSFYRPYTNYNAYRKSLTALNRLFNKYILGINLRDVNWIKIYRKDQLEFVSPELYSSIVESEICCKLLKSGCRAIEQPSVYLERQSGEAKAGKWNTLKKAITEIWTLYVVTRRFNKRHIVNRRASDLQ